MEKTVKTQIIDSFMKAFGNHAVKAHVDNLTEFPLIPEFVRSAKEVILIERGEKGNRLPDNMEINFMLKHPKPTLVKISAGKRESEIIGDVTQEGGDFKHTVTLSAKSLYTAFDNNTRLSYEKRFVVIHWKTARIEFDIVLHITYKTNWAIIKSNGWDKPGAHVSFTEVFDKFTKSRDSKRGKKRIKPERKVILEESGEEESVPEDTGSIPESDDDEDSPQESPGVARIRNCYDNRRNYKFKLSGYITKIEKQTSAFKKSAIPIIAYSGAIKKYVARLEQLENDYQENENKIAKFEEFIANI